jgi:tRNA-specific 2-thiouridylase
MEGRTPNPCVRCNQFVRFDGLLDLADQLGIDYVATGHYARIRYDRSRDERVLLKAVDPSKDQSYMLHTLQQDHLRRVLFPLGDITKRRTRELARQFDLPVADKPDSVEICFVAGKNYKEFLRQYAGDVSRPGDIVDVHGTVLGRHDGIHGFTIGQRKGLGVAAPEARYVIELRPRENQVVIGDRAEASGIGLTCSRLSFTGGSPGGEFRAGIKVRYRTPEREGMVSIEGDGASVRFDEPVWGIAPGQLAVFYDGDRVLGGGTIEAVQRAA